MTEEVMYNVMIVLGKIYNRQRALQSFDTENGKLVMAETLAAMELLLDLYAPAPDEMPRTGGVIDGIIRKFR